jgi:hypothetical protein
VIPVINDLKEKVRVLNCICSYYCLNYLSGATLRSSTPNLIHYKYYKNQRITICSSGSI